MTDDSNSWECHEFLNSRVACCGVNHVFHSVLQTMNVASFHLRHCASMTFVFSVLPVLPVFPWVLWWCRGHQADWWVDPVSNHFKQTFVDWNETAACDFQANLCQLKQNSSLWWLTKLVCHLIAWKTTKPVMIQLVLKLSTHSCNLCFALFIVNCGQNVEFLNIWCLRAIICHQCTISFFLQIVVQCLSWKHALRALEMFFFHHKLWIPTPMQQKVWFFHKLTNSFSHWIVQKLMSDASLFHFVSSDIWKHSIAFELTMKATDGPTQESKLMSVPPLLVFASFIHCRSHQKFEWDLQKIALPCQKMNNKKLPFLLMGRMPKWWKRCSTPNQTTACAASAATVVTSTTHAAVSFWLN